MWMSSDWGVSPCCWQQLHTPCVSTRSLVVSCSSPGTNREDSHVWNTRTSQLVAKLCLYAANITWGQCLFHHTHQCREVDTNSLVHLQQAIPPGSPECKDTVQVLMSTYTRQLMYLLHLIDSFNFITSLRTQGSTLRTNTSRSRPTKIGWDPVSPSDVWFIPHSHWKVKPCWSM